MNKNTVNYWILLVIYFAFTAQTLLAQNNSDLIKRLELLEKEISTLKEQLKEKEQKQVESKAQNQNIDESMFLPQTTTTTTSSNTKEKDEEKSKRIKDLGQFGINYRSDGFAYDGLRFGAYGESIFGKVDSGKGWENGFDANRIVLLGTYALTPDIIFNTELEFEHGGIAKDADDKLNGAIEVEQMFVDFRQSDYFTWRSPGVDVVPVGYVGLFHEPTQFYSANRPELYDGLIPATWFAPATGAYGKIVDGVNYQFQISTAVEDAGTTAEDEGGNVPEGGYDPGISGTEALSLGRSPIGDRTQLSNSLAYALRLSFLPVFVPGLSGSTSLYYTNDTTPRGAYGTNANGSTRLLGKSDLDLFDAELRYRMPNSGLELRSEFVRVGFGDTDNLRANNDTDPYNNVGDEMYGYSLEASYHVNLSPNVHESWELVPFYRYSFIDLQTSGVKGTDLNYDTGAGSKNYHTVGAALFPTPKLVLKLDYQIVLDDDSQTPNNKSILGAFGFFF